jgi:serine/threonine protein kinase
LKDVNFAEKLGSFEGLSAMLKEEHPPRSVHAIPRSIGSYQIGETIGEGSFSVVKWARDQCTNRPFACKIIAREVMDEPDIQTRFESEIRVQQRLQHPGIVCLCDLHRDDHYIYIVMELCSSGPLFQLIVQNGETPELFAKDIIRRVLQAVGFLHSQGIAHRDLSPENVLVDEFGASKLSDFGFACILAPNPLVSTPCGSPCYASPECLSGALYDPVKSDVWSLGVMVFVMMTGSFPWTTTNKPHLYDQIRRGDYSVPAGVSRKCADFIRKLMTVDPAARLTAEQALAHPWLAGGSFEPERPFDGLVLSLEKVNEFFAHWPR